MAGACEGKVALVAGASQGGTGTGTAVRLAAEGARVAICARSADGMRETLGRIEAVGGTGAMFECDLSDPDGGRDTLVSRAESALGSVDYLVYVAAQAQFGRFAKVTMDRLQQALELNLKAAWLLNQQVIAGLLAREAAGAIVNIGTSAARPLSGPPYAQAPAAQAGTVYGSTKAALSRMTQGAAAETCGKGISVNVVSPLAAIATPLVVAGGVIPEAVREPVDVMAEAILALLTGDPSSQTGLDTTSVDLLTRLRRPVRDLTGTGLLDGWQPEDLDRYARRIRAGRA